MNPDSIKASRPQAPAKRRPKGSSPKKPPRGQAPKGHDSPREPRAPPIKESIEELVGGITASQLDDSFVSDSFANPAKRNKPAKPKGATPSRNTTTGKASANPRNVTPGSTLSKKYQYPFGSKQDKRTAKTTVGQNTKTTNVPKDNQEPQVEVAAAKHNNNNDEDHEEEEEEEYYDEDAASQAAYSTHGTPHTPRSKTDDDDDYDEDDGHTDQTAVPYKDEINNDDDSADDEGPPSSSDERGEDAALNTPRARTRPSGTTAPEAGPPLGQPTQGTQNKKAKKAKLTIPLPPTNLDPILDELEQLDFPLLGETIQVHLDKDRISDIIAAVLETQQADGIRHSIVTLAHEMTVLSNEVNHRIARLTPWRERKTYTPLDDPYLPISARKAALSRKTVVTEMSEYMLRMAILEAKASIEARSKGFVKYLLALLDLKVTTELHLNRRLDVQFTIEELATIALNMTLDSLPSDYFQDYLLTDRRALATIISARTPGAQAEATRTATDDLNPDDKLVVETVSKDLLTFLPAVTKQLQFKNIDEVAQKQTLESKLKTRTELAQTEGRTEEVNELLSQVKQRDATLENLIDRKTKAAVDKAVRIQMKPIRKRMSDKLSAKNLKGRLASLQQAQPPNGGRNNDDDDDDDDDNGTTKHSNNQEPAHPAKRGKPNPNANNPPARKSNNNKRPGKQNSTNGSNQPPPGKKTRRGKGYGKRGNGTNQPRRNSNGNGNGKGNEQPQGESKRAAKRDKHRNWKRN